MRPTEEQSEIYGDTNRLIVVSAYAGTGKTTTCRGYTERHPDENYLYIAFNKSAQLDARDKFPRNIDVLTTHALAFPYTGRRYAPDRDHSKLGNITPIIIAQRFGCQYDAARDALDVLEVFLRTGSREIKAPSGLKLASGSVDLAKKVWKAAQDPNDYNMPMPHDGYLKLYLEEGAPGLGKYTRILFDEAQDANPLLMAILEEALDRYPQMGLMAVGDKYQSIYRFRGAMNAMESELFSGLNHHYLTASWRFGPEVAAAANAVLAERNAPKPLRGNGPASQLVRGGKPDGRHCYLSRTNADALRYAMEKVYGQDGENMRLAFCGGIERYRVERLIDGWNLYKRNNSQVRDTEFRRFGYFEELKDYAREVNDVEILSVCSVVEEFHADLPTRIEDIKKHSVRDMADADIVLSTAHKSKGLEWETVLLGDFFDWSEYETERRKDPAKYIEELHLLYVAATRARSVLHTNATLDAAMEKNCAPEHDRAQQTEHDPAENTQEQPVHER